MGGLYTQKPLSSSEGWRNYRALGMTAQHR
jgi:hypothetical protein